LIESAGLSGLVEIQMGTLGKALGVSGGFIAGSSPLREYLLNKARSFIFSTAPSPPVSAAAAEAIDLIRSPEGGILLQKLRENLRQFHSQAGVPAAGEDSPIVPLVVGAEGAALHFAEELWSSGFFVPAIRFPTVARGKARLRFTFSAAHTAGQIQNLSTHLRSLLTDAEPQDAAPA
jgi:7-keto-8-aminopelargonate synthetase-like enzyme